MAYMRMSAHEVDRACERFKEQFDKTLNDLLNKRKKKLMKRMLFPLSEEKAKLKLDKEYDTFYFQVAYSFGDDYLIYDELKTISYLTRAQDFITIDSFEADFISRYRKHNG